MKKKPHIVFLLESISQPRCIKRVKSFITSGYSVDIYGIDRQKYNINSFIEGHEIVRLNYYSDGENYVTKFISSYTSLKKITEKYQLSSTIFYSFGILLTSVLRLNKRVKYIYEIGDILYGYKRFYLIRPLIKYLDLHLIRNSMFTVLTSDGFRLFFNKIDDNKIIVQPNRLNSIFKSIQFSNNKKLDQDKLIFGYVGAFRYPKTVFRFAEIIGEVFPHHKFYFYGESKLTFMATDLEKRFNNIKNFGPFQNPEDLTSIYNQFDILVACYETENLNERIAEPNKYYEALYFKKPIIVSDETIMSKKIEELGTGFVINAYNRSKIIDFIDNLNAARISDITRNISLLQNNEFIDDNSIKILKKIEDFF